MLERAAVVGDEAASREAGVSRGTVRSWRARAKREGAAGGAVVSVAPSVAVASSSVLVGEGELERCERELEETRLARQASLDRSRELQRLGNDMAAQAAGRTAKDHAVTARAMAGEVVLLRESDVRVTQAEGERLAESVREFLHEAGIPLSAAVRGLLGACMRRYGSDPPEGVDVGVLGERARLELAVHFARLARASESAAVDGDEDDGGDTPTDAGGSS